MSDDKIYQDADIVWVKLGSNWWPGEVCGHQRQPEGTPKQIKRKPYCVVKFFDEDSFEYVKSDKHILPFNCNKKDEFISKGLEMFKAKKKFMEKFPTDVSTAERLSRSTTRSSLFFNTRSDSIVKAVLGNSPVLIDHSRNGRRCDNITKIINLTPNSKILSSTPSNTSPTYKCSMCDFQSTRQNVMVLHRKSHSGSPATQALISSSLNFKATISPAAKESNHKSVTTKTVSVGTSPPHDKTDRLLGLATLNSKKKIALSSERTTVTFANDDSDVSSDEITLKKGSVSKACDTTCEDILPFKQVNDTKAQSKSVHSTNDVRKSEEIQKSLLADWSDEEKDEEVEEIKLDTASTSGTSIMLPNVNRILFKPSTSVPAVLQSDKVELNESLVTKPLQKIRNIPKKDRRNIVFTDFENVEDPSNVASMVQVITIPDENTTAQPCSSRQSISLASSITSVNLEAKEEVECLPSTSPVKVLVPDSEPIIEIYATDQSLAVNMPTTQTGEPLLTQPSTVCPLNDNSCTVKEYSGNEADQPEPSTSTSELVEQNIHKKESSKFKKLKKDRSLPNEQLVEVELTDNLQKAEVGPRKMIEEQTESTLPILEEVHSLELTRIAEPNSLEVASVVETATGELNPANISLEESSTENISNVQKESIKFDAEKPYSDKVSSEKLASLATSHEKQENGVTFIQAAGFPLELHNTEMEALTQSSEEKCIVQPADCSEKSNSVESQAAETSNVPDTLEAKQEDIVETKPTSSAGKSSLSCFDFQEEEDIDILTSIAKFKKKYISPEKNYDFAKDIRPKTPDAEKLELELKDKLLSAEIESLLKTTVLPVELTSTTASVVERPASHDVRALPIKERGKRIFKSRNRFKAESCSSVSTTSPMKTATVAEIPNIPEAQMAEICATEPVVAKISSNDVVPCVETETNSNEPPTEKVQNSHEDPMDDKVTNSEEEIVGRIVFSPSEVFAPSAGIYLTESPDNRESHVSSSGMEVHTDSFSPSEDNEKSDFNAYAVLREQMDSSDAAEIPQHLLSAFADNAEEVQPEQEQEQQANLFYVAEENQPAYEVEIHETDVNNSTEMDSHCKEADDADHVPTEKRRKLEGITSDDREDTCEGKGNENNTLIQPIEAIVHIYDGLMADKEVASENTSIDPPECSTEENFDANNINIFPSEFHPQDVDFETATNVSHESPRTEPGVFATTNECHAFLAGDNDSEDGPVQNLEKDVERPEISSDDGSTVISDAEAEFGSPTSMLEEDRMLNSTRSNSLTPTTNLEYINNMSKSSRPKDNALKNTSRRKQFQLQGSRKERRLIHNLPSDMQESASNDIGQIFSPDSNPRENDKENTSEFTQTIDSLKEDTEFLRGKEENEHTITEDENVQNKSDTFDSVADSADEEEEEISSPPIEPLLDNSRDTETSNSPFPTNVLMELPKEVPNITNAPTHDSQIGEQFAVQIQLENYASINSETETNLDLNNEAGNALASEEPTAKIANSLKDQLTVGDNETQGSCVSIKEEADVDKDPYYTIIQNSDTTMKLHKRKEEKADATCESNDQDNLCEIAGEELSAAEALLLIPNQPSNILENSQDLSTPESRVLENASADAIADSLIADQEIKEEISDDIDSNLLESAQLTEGMPKEVLRRKRRSHMKVTPRKRVIAVPKQEKNAETEAKIPKLTQDTKPSVAKTETKKTFAEQYEEDFVSKYMKEKCVEEPDLLNSPKRIQTDLERSSNQTEKTTPEKVHITVDISNPLSSQIKGILNSHRPSVSEVAERGSAKKRKQTLEDEIPLFVIQKTSPKSVAEAEAADRETIAQIQNLCPHVEITRKSSKDDQSTSTTCYQAAKPQIINQQILRVGNSHPVITVTAKTKNLDEPMFDISNMPIVLSEDAVSNEKLHLVITPTTNPQVIKQFKNQQQPLLNSVNSAGNFPASSAVSTSGIPARRPSNVRTKRTPSRQQLQEQQSQQEKVQEHDNQTQQQQQQQLNLQQQCIQQHQLYQAQQQNQQQLQQEQRHQQVQFQHQTQLDQQQQQHLQQQQFHINQQNQLQQQIHDEQQRMQQQQYQMYQHQPQLQVPQQLMSAEKITQTTCSGKQMGVDTRGNKYLIIKAPPNTVLMGNNSPEAGMVVERLQTQPDTSSTSTQRKPRQNSNSKKSATIQPQATAQPSKPPNQHQMSMPIHSPIPHQAPSPSLQIQSNFNKEPHPNELHQFAVQEQQVVAKAIVETVPAKKGRGRPPKHPKTEVAHVSKEQTIKPSKSNAHGKRSSGSICESPRQRSSRSAATTKKNASNKSLSEEQRHSSSNSLPTPPIYTSSQQSMSYMPSLQTMTSSSSCAVSPNSLPFQTEMPSSSPQMMPQVMTGFPIETSKGSGVGYAVPSLPVPGYPQTFLLCELIDKKYKEVSSKPLYLSADRTRFYEVPDEALTEAHKKLSDCQREPNPDVLQVVSSGLPHVFHPRVSTVESINHESDKNVKPSEVLMQNHEQLIDEQASAMLCLQEQIVQEQIAQEQLMQDQLNQKQISQEQLVQEQLAQEQLVQEQLVQEQFVQEQFAQDQLVQDQFVQGQFVQGHLVQEQFMQQHMEDDQDMLHMGTIETEVVQDNLLQHLNSQQPPPGSVLLNFGTQQVLVDYETFNNVFGQNNANGSVNNGSTYTINQDAVQEFFTSLRSPGGLTPTEMLEQLLGQQQIILDDNMLQSSVASPDILTVALDDSGLYSEEQFINSSDILQIETPEGLRLIGTAAGNAGIIFQPMTTPIQAKTSETNVLLNQGPKMSTVEIPSDKSKPKFEADPSSTATLEDCLNVIGVPAQSPSIPASLELPTSVTNPAIVAKTRTPTPGTIAMNEIIATGLCHHPDITSLPPVVSHEQELHYEFFPSSTDAHNDKMHGNEESVIADMGEYAVVSSGGNFDDPGR